MSGFVRGDLLAGNEVGVGDLFTAKVCALEVALNPFWRCIGSAGLNQVLADFGVPHVREGIL